MQKGKVIKEFGVLPREWKVSFEIKPLRRSTKPTNIFHATTGGNKKNHGERTPAIFFTKLSTRLFVCSSINDNPNLCKISPRLPLGKWTKIVVQQTQKEDLKYYYEIFINDKKKISIVNKKPRIFKNVKYYASDPFYQAANAMIRNVVIEKYQPKGNI